MAILAVEGQIAILAVWELSAGARPRLRSGQDEAIQSGIHHCVSV